MEKKIQYVVWAIGIGLALGIGLISYADSKFATKESVISLDSKVEKIDGHVYEMWTLMTGKK